MASRCDLVDGLDGRLLRSAASDLDKSGIRVVVKAHQNCDQDPSGNSRSRMARSLDRSIYETAPVPRSPMPLPNGLLTEARSGRSTAGVRLERSHL